MNLETQAANEAPGPTDKAPRTSWKTIRAGWTQQIEARQIPAPPDFPLSNVTYSKACVRIAEAAKAGDADAIEAVLKAVQGKQTYAQLSRTYAQACLAVVAMGKVHAKKPAKKPAKKAAAAAEGGA